MPWLFKRPLPPGAELEKVRLLESLEGLLDDPDQDRNETVREILAQLMHGRSYEALAASAPLAAFALDPRHVAFEAEHYAATDSDRFAIVKPLLWLWKCLDQTPLGQNIATGIPLRALLAKRIFRRAGDNLKIFQNVEVSVGYNIEAGDNVVIHRNVFIDDIGGVELHDDASLSDFVNVYSHFHNNLNIEDVFLKRTVIGRGVRVAYHATVLAGTVLSDDSMLGAMALATRDLEPHVIGLGIPAKPRVWKERSGDPRFASFDVDSKARKPAPEIRANPDFADDPEA